MNYHGKKILIIDDSNTNIVLLEAILNSKGYNILTAINVQQAKSILSNDLPQLILLDLLMPHISGYQFLEEIKNDEETRDIPVIVVSAVTDEQNKKKTMVMGAVCRYTA